jgi:predicted Zn-ribbon and HTH transcriptional regulator
VGGEVNDIGLSSIREKVEENVGQNRETVWFSRILEVMEEESKHKKEILENLEILNKKCN